MEQNLYELITDDNYNLKYSQLFSMLLQLSEDQAIMKLQKLSINRNEWNKLLEMYKYHNPEKEKEYSYLSNLYEKYIKEFQIEKKKEVNTELEFYVKKIEDYVKCNISAIEYCDQKRIALSTLDNASANIFKAYPELYNKYHLLRDKKSIAFENKMKKLVDKIINEDDFDLFDYYYETGLSFDVFLHAVKEMIDSESFLAVKIKINKLKKVAASLACIGEEQIMGSKNVISGREITDIEKKKIICILKNHNMPLKIYPIAVRKYLKNSAYLFEDEYSFNMNKILDNILLKDDFELHEYVSNYILDNNQNYNTFWAQINSFVKEKFPEHLETIKK